MKMEMEMEMEQETRQKENEVLNMLDSLFGEHDILLKTAVRSVALLSKAPRSFEGDTIEKMSYLVTTLAIVGGLLSKASSELKTQEAKDAFNESFLPLMELWGELDGFMDMYWDREKKAYEKGD